MKRLSILIPLFFFFVFGIASSSSAQKKAYNLRLFSAGEGSMTYASMSGLVALVKRHKPEIWADIACIPSQGPYAGFRAIEKGEGEGTYSNVPQMIELWTNIGPLAKRPIPPNKKALIGIALWEHQNFIITRANRDDIKSLKDLEGKNITYSLPGSTTEKIGSEIHAKLGVKSKVRPMELDAISDALRAGMIDATWAYVLSDIALPGWLKDLELRLDVKIVPLSEKEVATAAEKVAGLAPILVPLNSFTQRMKGPASIWTAGLGQFWVLSPDLPEEAVYEMCEGLYVNRKAVTGIYAGHWKFEKDPFGLQEKHLDVANRAKMLLHPGVAKWLKKHGAWKDRWNAMLPK